MSINPHDDYERLAKLLYPSIEASGNVYYGQTKKLTTDEVLDKNDLNFESHIETFRERDDYSEEWWYQSYFCWKLGPLKGSIKIKPIDKEGHLTSDNFPSNALIGNYGEKAKAQLSNFIVTAKNIGDSYNNKPFSIYTFYDSDNGNVPSIIIHYLRHGVDTQTNSIALSNSTSFVILGSNEDVSPDSNLESIIISDLCTDSDYTFSGSAIVDFIDDYSQVDLVLSGGSDEPGAVFAKYLLSKSIVENNNFISSGNFKTYENDIDCSFVDLYATSGYSPIDSTDYNIEGRSFYLSNSDPAYLYIQITNDDWDYFDKYLPLTFKSHGSSTVQLVYRNESPCSYVYNINNGEYFPYTNSSIISLSDGDTCSFKCSEFHINDSSSYNNNNHFNFTGIIEAFGNIHSLLDKDNFASIVDLSSYGNSLFRELFIDCSSLIKPPILPATTLTNYCYESMFNGCTSLKVSPKLPAKSLTIGCYWGMLCGCTSLEKAPKLPATNLATSCYGTMFKGCTSLEKAPMLLATNLAERCYREMFLECTSLEKVPKLPATTLATNCYEGMFARCTSLEKAPRLPATILAIRCYEDMFSRCTSLEKAPRLPATNLAERCYWRMFQGCTSLEKAPRLPAAALTDGCYESMFQGCTSLEKAPRLTAITLTDDCYESMFQGCTSLEKAPKLPATALTDDCYKSMFYGCPSVTSVAINAEYDSEYETNSAVSNIVSSLTGDFYADSSWLGHVPNNWNLLSYENFVEDYEEGHEDSYTYDLNTYLVEYNVQYRSVGDSKFKSDVLVASGSDSDNNGRGELNSNTTFNMLQSNPFNSANLTTDDYNHKDGSFTQEIWGYKCFNSPVSFRNGLYGENARLTTYKVEEARLDIPSLNIASYCSAISTNKNDSKLVVYNSSNIGLDSNYNYSGSCLVSSGDTSSITAYNVNHGEDINVLGSIVDACSDLSTHNNTFTLYAGNGSTSYNSKNGKCYIYGKSGNLTSSWPDGYSHINIYSSDTNIYGSACINIKSNYLSTVGSYDELHSDSPSLDYTLESLLTTELDEESKGAIAVISSKYAETSNDSATREAKIELSVSKDNSTNSIEISTDNLTLCGIPFMPYSDSSDPVKGCLYTIIAGGSSAESVTSVLYCGEVLEATGYGWKIFRGNTEILLDSVYILNHECQLLSPPTCGIRLDPLLYEDYVGLKFKLLSQIFINSGTASSAIALCISEKT